MIRHRVGKVAWGGGEQPREHAAVIRDAYTICKSSRERSREEIRDSYSAKFIFLSKAQELESWLPIPSRQITIKIPTAEATSDIWRGIIGSVSSGP